MPIDSNTRNL